MVDPSTGLVTGVGSGTAMITAQTGDGARAGRQIRVMPNFHGAWTGNYSEVSCTDEQGRRVDCWHPGRVSGVGFFIYQTGATLTVDLIHSGHSNFTDGTAIVEADGQLTVQDRGGAEEYGVVTTVWRLGRGSDGSLSGSMGHTVRYSDGTEFKTENSVYDVIKWSDLNR